MHLSTPVYITAYLYNPPQASLVAEDAEASAKSRKRRKKGAEFDADVAISQRALRLPLHGVVRGGQQHGKVVGKGQHGEEQEGLCKQEGGVGVERGTQQQQGVVEAMDLDDDDTAGGGDEVCLSDMVMVGLVQG